MGFDIRGLDKIDWDCDEAEEVSMAYQEDLLRLFLDSPEGEALRRSYPDAGFWAFELMRLGYGYLGVTVPKMTVRNVEEVVTELFPRKVILMSEDEADDTIPELVAFWEYLKREYDLPNAESILKSLRKIGPGFPSIMNDPSRFGIGKSLHRVGQDAGFDMTTEEGMHAFMQYFNAQQDAKEASSGESRSNLSSPLRPEAGGSREDRKKKSEGKNKRRAARAARKRN